MTHVTETKFIQWNEAMSEKHNPDLHHNHPNPIMRFLERRRTGAIIQYLGIKESDRILDVGCGAGNMLDRIEGAHGFGVDISNFVLSLSKQRLGDRIGLSRGNAEILPFKDHTFDKVFCSEVIEHTINPDKVIDEIYRVLKSGGRSVLSIPNENFTIKFKQFLKSSGIARIFLPADKGDESKLYCVHEWHLHAFSLGLLKKMTRGKFEITAYRGIPFGAVPVKYVVNLQKAG